MDKLIAINKQRFYEIDFTDQYENTAPYELRINDFVLKSKFWGPLACDLTKYLLEITDKTYSDLAPFRVSWSLDRPMYTEIKLTNYKEVVPGKIYVCANWNGTQGARMIKEILEFFKVPSDSYKMIIKRFPSSEKKEDREFFYARMKKEYISYLQSVKKLSESNALKEANNIDKICDNYERILGSFINLYLMDDHKRVTAMISNIKAQAKKDYPAKSIIIANKLSEYAKFVKYRIEH